jgi:nucleotide-binding universal stress UspA family protein
MSMPNKIVVGVDGSPTSVAALEWAHNEAQHTGAEVVALHAWQYPYSRLRPAKNDQRDQMKIDALHELAGSIAAVRTAAGEAADVRAELVEDPPAKALLDASADAMMTVVGTRGRGGFASMVLGSVSRSVVQHSRRPVVLVRHGPATAADLTPSPAETAASDDADDHSVGVVVGWSGSPASTAAVDVAAEFAGRHNMELTIVLAWDFLAQPRHEFDPHITREKVELVLDEIVATAADRHPTVKIRGQAELGIPSDVVSEAAKHADLLVIGVAEEHTGPFAAWSADKVLRHTQCPVMFVPSPISQHR